MKPLLSGSDKPFAPPDGRCPACGGTFGKGGVAYLSGGALLLSKDGRNSIDSARLRAFLHFGFHGVDPEMHDSGDVQIVANLQGGQFDLQWCSIACMRAWLLSVLDEVERQAGGAAAPGT